MESVIINSNQHFVHLKSTNEDFSVFAQNKKVGICIYLSTSDVNYFIGVVVCSSEIILQSL